MQKHIEGDRVAGVSYQIKSNLFDNTNKNRRWMTNSQQYVCKNKRKDKKDGYRQRNVRQFLQSA